MMGLPNSAENEEKSPRKFGIRKSKAAQSSFVEPFCMIVPVVISRCLANILLDAFAVAAEV